VPPQAICESFEAYATITAWIVQCVCMSSVLFCTPLVVTMAGRI